MPNLVNLTVPIDHIIARKHGGQTKVDNLTFSCTIFNKYKGSDLASIDPKTDKLTSLYDPRKESWQKHFRIEDSRIIALTPEGRVTVRLLKFNRQERCEERKLLLGAGVLKFNEI